MHSAILSRLRSDSRVASARIASGRGSIIGAFDDRTPHPLWIAKTARKPEDVARLRKEFEALGYLQPWSGELGIPRALEWDATDRQAVLIQSGVRGRRESVSLALDAGDAEVRKRFEEVLGWLKRFQAAVPAPAAMTVKELAEKRVEDLGSRRGEAGEALDGVIAVLGRVGSAGQRGAIAVHGDFYPANVLFVKPGLSVVDWSAFGTGFPLQDAFSYVANTDYYRRGRVCRLVESYRHAFFSGSRVNDLIGREIGSDGSSEQEARDLFYCFLATQICADASTPMQFWLEIARYLEPFGYPGPCTPLPAPGVE